MTDVRDVVVRAKLDEHQCHHDDAEGDYLGLGFVCVEVDDLGCDVSDHERYHECDRGGEHREKHIQYECSDVRLIVAGHLL